MRPIGVTLALLLSVPVVLPGSAGAQQEAPLTYTERLGPNAVMQVQDQLRQRGYYDGRVDGVWGPDSQAALERFQQSHGLQVSGQINPATAATLGLVPARIVGADPGPPRTLAERPAAPARSDVLSPSSVRNVQSRLRSLGFYRGNVDGIWGPGTQTALERFQQGRGLQATGQLNPATAAALGFNPNDLTGADR